MILCKEEIIAARDAGRIHIEPFDEQLVGINSVDIRLGDDVYELTGTEPRDLYNPDDSRWRKMQPVTAGELRLRMPGYGKGVLNDDDRCYVFRSGGFYLATTYEAIGSCADPAGVDGQEAIVPEMKARSTVGRQGLTVALCAGLGDVGYKSRWALEVRVVACGDVALAVGTPIAQVVFHTGSATSAAYGGVARYQNANAVRFLPKPLSIVRS